MSTSAPPADDSYASKIRTLLDILRRFIGVADIANARFSLPSQLLEPVPNLEYWNYLDRPETFISIGDSDDELERFFGVLRFWFTKDLKFVKGKPCKPYNSTLGEFFRCVWDVEEQLSPLPAKVHGSEPNSSSTSVKSQKLKRPIRVTFLTEQTSHHPPVSAFHIDCPEKGITARGYDQISAKFTGTSIKVTPGAHNLGIFITLHNRNNESYRLTHPAAHLGGFLRGSLNIFVSDVCYITCQETRMKCILHYLEDGWIGKAKHRVEGVIYDMSDDDENENFTKVKDVPKSRVRANIEGSWVSQIYYTIPGSNVKHLLIDLDPLLPAPKTCPPEELQASNESRKLWSGVSEAIKSRNYSLATTLKREIEEYQRNKAAERLEKGHQWKPRFFEASSEGTGKPTLTEEGRKTIQDMLKGEYRISEGVGNDHLLKEDSSPAPPQ